MLIFQLKSSDNLMFSLKYTENFKVKDRQNISVQVQRTCILSCTCFKYWCYVQIHLMQVCV